MKRMIFILCVLATLLMLSSCAEESEDKKLAVCGSYAVPGMFCYDLKGDSFSCSVVDRDNQGRVLFLYETKNNITEETEKAYVICQKIDSSYVYFYEDVCYVLSNKEDEAVALLKDSNDWNNPLAGGKMSRRKCSISHDLYIMIDSKLNFNDAKEACCKALGIEDSQIENIIRLDLNEFDQELFWISVREGGNCDTYIAMVDTKYEVLAAKVDVFSREQIYEFKQQNGWLYSTGD